MRAMQCKLRSALGGAFGGSGLRLERPRPGSGPSPERTPPRTGDIPCSSRCCPTVLRSSSPSIRKSNGRAGSGVGRGRRAMGRRREAFSVIQGGLLLCCFDARGAPVERRRCACGACHGNVKARTWQSHAQRAPRFSCLSGAAGARRPPAARAAAAAGAARPGNEHNGLTKCQEVVDNLRQSIALQRRRHGLWSVRKGREAGPVDDYCLPSALAAHSGSSPLRFQAHAGAAAAW
jgi:hypothetical protein